MGLCGSAEAGLTPEEKAQRRAALSKSKDFDAKMHKEHRQEEVTHHTIIPYHTIQLSITILY
jgi:hypothetical protein